MIATKERAAAISRAHRAVKLLIEHDTPTPRDLGVARDCLNECYNMPDSRQVWEAVDRLEITAANVCGVPDIDQACAEEIRSATPSNQMLSEDRTIGHAPEFCSPMPGR